MFDLSGKIALITGGGRGLGREICEAMAESGADVVCADINAEGAQETAEFIKNLGHQSLSIKADVSDAEQVVGMVTQTVEKLGTIDILFCNVGIPNPPLMLHELTIEDWDRVMSVNLRSVFLCMRATLPIMMKKKKGSIIIITSVAGLVAGSEQWSFQNTSAYGTSKAALIMLTRHVAVAYAKEGIRINAIAPGGHETWPVGIPRDLLKKANDKLVKFIPMGRLGQPIEIKGLAVYLASDASSFLTGQIITQDGGFTA